MNLYNAKFPLRQLINGEAPLLVFPKETSAAEAPEAMRDLFRRLGEWESSLATVPLWGLSPWYTGKSAEVYDSWAPLPEPR